MAEKDNLQHAKEAIAAINAHDIDGYLKHVDNAYVGESETMGTVHGHSGLRQMLTTMFQAFPDFHLEIQELIGSDAHVISRVIASGTHKGNFAGVAPTNKKVSWHSCNVVEVRNGKAIRSRIYGDNISLMRQLGALPMPTATTAG
jgi:steroid delta-isomerase-like uncharacterized protein